MGNYTIKLTGSQSKHEGEITCENADIYVSGSSTLTIDKLNATGKVTIHCVSASFIIIKELNCDTMSINHGYSSSMRFDNIFNCNACDIDVHYSSRLDITGGSITKMTGNVTYTSFVRNVATVGKLEVMVDHKHKAPHSDIFGSTYINK